MKLHFLNIVLLAFFTSCFVSCNNNLSRKYFKKGELLYNPKISTDIVDKTGHFLVEQKFFTDKVQTTVVLDNKSDSFFLIIVVDKLFINDTFFDKNFEDLAIKAKEQIFKDDIFVTKLADPTLNLFRTIK